MKPSSLPRTILFSLLLMVIGFAVALLGALADILGIGTGEGFGYYQLIVVISGIIIFLIGLAIQVNQRSSGDPSSL